MNLHRLAALSVSLLLGLGVVATADAHPWHAPHVPTSGGGHAPTPPGPPVGHFHGYAPPPGGGYWHAIPVAAPHASRFAAHSPYGGYWHHDWGHGDIRYFHHYDWYAWHNGYWHHGYYGPRFGWWWVVGGVWFFYPVAVYPYPDPYVPSEWNAPPPPSGEAVAASGSYWYFCPASNAYYPYVPSCPTGWQQVPAQPSGQMQPAAMPATAAPPPPADGPPGG